MKKPVILSVASISRAWLTRFHRLEIKNLSVLQDCLFLRGNDRPLLTFSNHISTLDDPVMWGGLLTNTHISELIERDQMRYAVAAEELIFTNPLFNWFFSTGQAIPIARGQGLFQPGMDRSLDILNSGRWLHFFPEGRVVQHGIPLDLKNSSNLASKENYMIAPLKWGIGRLIMESSLKPILLPVVLRGFDDMKPLDRLPRLCKDIEIVVGDPVDSVELIQATSNISDSDRRRSLITELVKNSLQSTLNKATF